MNDEPSPSTANWPPQHPDAVDLDHGRRGDRGPDEADAPDEAAVATEQKKRIKAKRIGYLDDILRNFDILIYAEISAVYYLDCSFLRFVLRAFVQLLWLTPKSDILPEMPSNRPYIYPICGSNFLCFLVHLWFPPPSAGEATRGYLHGGLLIDWVGQQGPSSKFRLLLLDLFILGLQLVMLSASLKLQKVKRKREARASSGGEEAAPGTAEASSSTNGSRQDVDSEERGVLRRQSTLSNLQDHGPNERDGLLSESDAPESNAQASLDALNSGQALVAELYILDTIREQFDVAVHAEPATGDAFLSHRDRSRRLAAALQRRRLAFTETLPG